MNTTRNIIEARRRLTDGLSLPEDKTCEGGCGVIGIIGSEPLAGRLIIRSCAQMRNRGNGKGGGIAAVGIFGEEYKNHYALHIAFLDESVRAEVEKEFVEPVFDVAHAEWQPNIDDHREAGLEICPPKVRRYFVTPKSSRVEQFQLQLGIDDAEAASEELIFQNSFRLNTAFYAQASPPKAFVLSHARDLMILKAVGYAEEVAQFYQLQDTKANVWIGHQRYPTRGRVWHPGGAHPFAGLHEALVHNGDFANYYAVSEYLEQRGMKPLFVTDTEVSALLFDHYSRVLNYPIEYVIEALAPTPEGDFERLTKRRQRIYRAIQTAHIHGSPDGPWFFIIARNDPATGFPQLIGITDVSMLRPQVFAFQSKGSRSFGAIASEKQAIDAFFEDLAASDPEVPPVADIYWNARGGSSADGGAFIYTLDGNNSQPEISVADKFGNPVRLHPAEPMHRKEGHPSGFTRALPRRHELSPTDDALTSVNLALPAEVKIGALLPNSVEVLELAVDLKNNFRDGDIEGFKKKSTATANNGSFLKILSALTYLRNRNWNPTHCTRAEALSMFDEQINSLLDALPGTSDSNSRFSRLTFSENWEDEISQATMSGGIFVVDARGFPPEGPKAACRAVVQAYERGWKNFIVYRCHGDRFIGCGLGIKSDDVNIDIYGSSGDYLGSGLDGAQIFVHGNAQDQVGQILKSGRIVIYGDVGQTFLYGAKGGETFVKGNAAGRPLINAVGQIRAVINGTCLDYLAESFMAGRETGDGFVIINGVTFNQQGASVGLEQKYPGNNLFSLASGGACYLNDPYRTVKSNQLNGAEFVPFHQRDWEVIAEYLLLNEMLFGLSTRNDLLMVDGVLRWPKEVFRKVVAARSTHKLDWSSLTA